MGQCSKAPWRWHKAGKTLNSRSTRKQLLGTPTLAVFGAVTTLQDKLQHPVVARGAPWSHSPQSRTQVEGWCKVPVQVEGPSCMCLHVLSITCNCFIDQRRTGLQQVDLSLLTAVGGRARMHAPNHS